jgi:hypothetical protein
VGSIELHNLLELRSITRRDNGRDSGHAIHPNVPDARDLAACADYYVSSHLCKGNIFGRRKVLSLSLGRGLSSFHGFAPQRRLRYLRLAGVHLARKSLIEGPLPSDLRRN